MSTQTKPPSDRASEEGSVFAGGPLDGARGQDTAPVKSASGHDRSDAPLNLPPGLFMTSDHRYYFNGIGPYPSVTTILDIMSKPALITWKAKEAAKAMLRLAVALREES